MTIAIEVPVRPVAASDALHVRLVRIVTDRGDMLAELYPDRAPVSVAAFLTEVATGSFDGGSFHRVVRADNDQGFPGIEVIQAGCAAGIRQRADTPVETTGDTGLRHEDGMLSLPRLNGSDGSAQGFFICIGAQPALDAEGGRTADGLGFAAFGRVVAGMDLARMIHQRPTKEDAPTDYLKGQLLADAVTIHRIGIEAEAPDARLGDLAQDYWRFGLREFPLGAFLGGLPGSSGLLDEASEAAQARRARACDALLVRARAIDGEGLATEARTTLALIVGQLEAVIAADRHDEHLRPRLFPFSFAGTPTMLVQQASLDTFDRRDEVLARLEAVPAWLRANLDLLREEFRRGYRLPRALVPPVLAMLDSDLAEDGFAAQLIKRFAESVPTADAAQLDAQRVRAAKLAAEAIAPALAEVRVTIAGLVE